MTTEQMSVLLEGLSSGCYIRQVLAIMLLFLTGIAFLYGCSETMEKRWLYLLAYPMGLAIWCVTGFLLLTVGIPFRWYTQLPAMVLVVLANAIFPRLRHRIGLRKDVFGRKGTTLLAALAVMLVAACVATGGISSFSVSNDTMYYYMYYPEILVQNGAYLSSYDVFLSDVGPMAALIGTIPAMLGFDQFYGIQQVFHLNFILIFALLVYERARTKLQHKTAVGLTVAVTLLLATTTPYVVLSKWILANVYVMSYCFILFGLAYKMDTERKEGEQSPRDYLAVIMILSAMISMLRMEGGMLMCFMIVCISTLGFSNKELNIRFLLPAAMMPCLYYIRYFLFLKVSPVYSFLTWQKAAVAVGAIVLLGHYIGAVRGKRLLRLQQKTGWLILLGLLAVNAGLCAMAPSAYMVVLKAFWQNIIYQEGWGYSIYLLVACMIAVCMVKSHRKPGDSIHYETLVLLGYVLFTLAVSFARGGGLRRGIGDSGNRVMLQVIPFLIYVLACKAIDLIESTEEHRMEQKQEETDSCHL